MRLGQLGQPTFSTTVYAWPPECDAAASTAAGTCVDEWGVRLLPSTGSGARPAVMPRSTQWIRGINNQTLGLIAAIAAAAIAFRRMQ